jgi:hypothetical protein
LIAAVTYALRFWQGKWRRMRVIETVPENTEARSAYAE